MVAIHPGVARMLAGETGVAGDADGHAPGRPHRPRRTTTSFVAVW
jgi:hypothetical protein